MLPDHIGQLKPHQLTRHSLSDEVLAFTDHSKDRETLHHGEHLSEPLRINAS